MKFIYEYRTSENKRLEGVISAPSKDDVFQILKTRGIRPSRVYEAPGFFNKLFGKYKRWIVIVALLAIVMIMMIREFSSNEDMTKRSNPRDSQPEDIYIDGGYAKPIDRRQIWGDEAVISEAMKDNWKVIFPNPADRLLALFAQPGYTMSVFPRIPATIKNDFKKSLGERFRIESSELDEYKQMKCIVEGMKIELREYLSAGGNLDGYFKRLVSRQKEESAFLRKAKSSLNDQIRLGVDPMEAWQKTNKVLRDQGLETIPMPPKN